MRLSGTSVKPKIKSRRIKSRRVQSSAQQVLLNLKKHYPEAHCELHHSTPFELLVATILSAQCTDKKVNQVTPQLFAEFPSPHALAAATSEDVERLIRPTGFYKNKARSLLGAARKIVDIYEGKLPQTMAELITLDGVGRKTANVVLGNAFGISSGVVVDTHVGRLSQRLGWTKQKNPIKIELDLQKLFLPSEWILLSHLLIWHGRQICKARKPSCSACFLFDLCPKKNV